MKAVERADRRQIVLRCGLAGGAAELAWIWLYSTAAGASSVAVAREVTASLWPAAAGWAAAPALGVAIHLALSVVLAAALVPLLLRSAVSRPEGATFQVSLAAAASLALVWAVNFLLVLPVLNPHFLTLMPLAATLISKLLFAAAVVGTLRHHPALLQVRPD